MGYRKDIEAKDKRKEFIIPGWIFTILIILLLPIKLVAGDRLVRFYKEAK